MTVSSGDVAPGIEALAILVTEPASRSACVTVYVAVHVSDAPVVSVPPGKAGQDTFAMRSSLTVTGSVIVTFPEFVTTYV